MIGLTGLAIIYISGMMTGAFLMVLWAIQTSEKRKATPIEVVSDLVPKNQNTLSTRMERIKAITETQLNMLQVDVSYEQKKIVEVLEDEKVQLLESILADGLDPVISTMDASGNISNMKLSEYMSGPARPEPRQEPKIRQMGKFTVYKGGKPDDNGGKTSH